MEISKKLAVADKLRHDIEAAVTALMKSGMTRAAAMDRVILSPAISKAHRWERQQAAEELNKHARIRKDPIKTADEAIDALAERHRANNPAARRRIP
jgi:hypothetical protein